VATPTPAPPACLTVPNLVGMTVAKARGAWRGAGFTGGFTADGAGRQTVVTQSQPAGACLPPGTSIAVTV
jgi:beta-lactam-binding protein with PASTA domain